MTVAKLFYRLFGTDVAVFQICLYIVLLRSKGAKKALRARNFRNVVTSRKACIYRPRGW